MGASEAPRPSRVRTRIHRVWRNGGDGLKKTPSQGRGGDDDARLEAIGEHAARDLHQRVCEKERAKNESLRPEVEIELLRDHRHRDRDGCAIDIVDRDEHQHEQEDAPADLGGRLGDGRIEWARGVGRHMRVPLIRFAGYRVKRRRIIDLAGGQPVCNLTAGPAKRAARARATSAPRILNWIGDRAHREASCPSGDKADGGWAMAENSAGRRGSAAGLGREPPPCRASLPERLRTSISSGREGGSLAKGAT